MKNIISLVIIIIGFSQVSMAEKCPSFKSDQAASLTKLKQYIEHSASVFSIAGAICRHPVPSDKEVEEWLNTYAKGDSTDDNSEYGIGFQNESSKLLDLFDKLTTKNHGDIVEHAAFRSNCTKVLCAAKEIFGPSVGPKLLYMLAKYGMNGSPLQKDASPWSQEELDPALQALEDMPPGLLPLEDDKRFVRFERGYTRTEYTDPNFGGACAAANSSMEFFDCGFQVSQQEQISTAFHEMSHYVAEQLGLDEMDKWRELSGWEETTKPNGRVGFNTYWEASKSECMVSGYGSTNPAEDFAESMVAYRYQPDRMKDNCPAKYKFLKDLVFQGIEYTDKKLCEGKKIDGGIVNSLKWHLKKIKYQL